MMAFPFLPFHQIFQTPDHVAFLHEENHGFGSSPSTGGSTSAVGSGCGVETHGDTGTATR